MKNKSKELLDYSHQNISEQDLPRIWQQIANEQRECLALSYNQIPIAHLHLPAQKLQSLRFLYLYKSKIQRITIDGDLPNLRILHLGANQLEDLYLPRGFADLEYLRLDKNQLKKVVLADWQGLKSIQSVFLKGNEVDNIPQEILEREENCKDRLWTFLGDKQKSGGVQNNEVKVILVGNGSVGKTQIAKRIELQQKYRPTLEHESTHAISLLERKLDCRHLKDLRSGHLLLNIWDFGGQDIYHATHRMFMQSNALFLLVWDTVNEANPIHLYNKKEYRNEPLGYWLRYIACFGGESPVLVLQNKIDRAGEPILPEPTKKRYQQKHSNITRFLELSAWTGEGFRLLEDRIEQLFAPTTHLGKQLLQGELPASWVAVRNRVRTEQAQTNGQKQITEATFRAWCKEAKAEDSAQYILEFLHDTGVLFYQKRYFSGSIILDQAWAIEAVYKVLDKDQDYYEVLKGNKGRLNYRDLCVIWEKESDAERELFIRFMLDCELCFETTLKNEDRYYVSFQDRTFVVPQLLPEKKPNYLTDGEYMEACGYRLEECLEVRYYFLPPVFMQRFIVQAKKFASVEVMWRQGVLLEDGKTYALVEADYPNRKVLIHYPAAAKRFVRAIVEQLEIIAQEGKVQAMRQYDLSETDERTLLQKTLQRVTGIFGRKTTPSNEHSLQRERGWKGYEEASKAVPKPKTIRLFLSYAQEDEGFAEKFRRATSLLQRQGRIAIWSEADLVPGENRLTQSLQALEESEMFVLLVSSDYVATDKWDKDLKNATKAFRAGKTKIVPILIRPTHYKGTILEELQCLPKSGEAITEAANRDKAWLEVVSGLRDLL